MEEFKRITWKLTFIPIYCCLFLLDFFAPSFGFRYSLGSERQKIPEPTTFHQSDEWYWWTWSSNRYTYSLKKVSVQPSSESWLCHWGKDCWDISKKVMIIHCLNEAGFFHLSQHCYRFPTCTFNFQIPGMRCSHMWAISIDFDLKGRVMITCVTLPLKSNESKSVWLCLKCHAAMDT